MCLLVCAKHLTPLITLYFSRNENVKRHTTNLVKKLKVKPKLCCLVVKKKEKKTTEVKIILNNVEIERENKTKFLGVIIDDKIFWKAHTKHS